MDEGHEVYEEQRGATKDTRTWTKDTKCTKGNFVARRAAELLRKSCKAATNITKRAGLLRRTRRAWTKDTKCTKSSGGATKILYGVAESKIMHTYDRVSSPQA